MDYDEKMDINDDIIYIYIDIWYYIIDIMICIFLWLFFSTHENWSCLHILVVLKLFK